MGAEGSPLVVPATRPRRDPVAAPLAILLALLAGAARVHGESIGRWRSPAGTLYFGDRPPAGSVPLGREEIGTGVEAEAPSATRAMRHRAPRRAAPDGTVVHVDDGDSFRVAMHGEEVRVRIAEIDAPEAGQPYGDRAREVLAGLIGGRVIRIDEVDQDRYGRVVARVEANGFDVGAEMVRRGAARVYRSYATSASLYALENEARAARRGLWALPEAEREAPWSWRRRNGGLAEAPASEPAEGPVVGNARSGIYHRPDCPDYGSISPLNRVSFPSRAAAEAAGYRQARNCP